MEFLEKRLRKLSTHEYPPQEAAHHWPAPAVADQDTQTDEVAPQEDSHNERSLAELNEAVKVAKAAELSRAEDEAEQLHHSLEQVWQELAREVQACCRTEDAAQEANSRLASFS